MSPTLQSEPASSPADSASAPPSARPWLAVYTLAAREWVRFVRQRNRLVGAIGQPLVFWLLFGAGLGPSFRLAGAEGTSYREYFFPGTLVLIVLFTAIFATISIIEDRREGFLQGVLVAPCPRWAMVLGKLLGGTLIALAQALLFLLLGLTLGIHFSAAMWLSAAALLFVLALALTGLGFVIAWRMDSTQGFHAIMSVFLMPMWLLSGAFFPPPTGAGLGWGERLLAGVIWANPLTYSLAALRRVLYLGTNDPPLPPQTPSLAAGCIVTVVFAGLMFVASCRAARIRTAGDLL